MLRCTQPPWSRHFRQIGFRILQVKIFTMAFSPRLGGFDDEPLREFIADKRVHSVESWHFVHEGTPYWSAFVGYTICEDAPAPREHGRNRNDFRDRLRLSPLATPLVGSIR